MNDLEIVNLLHERMLEIYHQEKLKCLRGSTYDNYIINGRNILEWHSKATSNLKQKFNHFENLDNMLIISDEIMYFTAQLYFFRPYLYNPLENPIRVRGKVYYPYKMYLSDRRYFMFSEIVIEKIYGFWGQIANLLAASLYDEVNDYQIFFPVILQKISNQTSENFLWLDNFMKHEYAEINSHRRMIVHHRGLETKFRADHNKSFSSQEDIEKLIHERDELPDYFKMHIELTLTGFEKSLELVSE